MATAAKKTAVAVAAQGELAFSQEAPEWAQGPGRGNENVGAQDMVLPRIEIVQAQSPIKDGNEDARDGHMFNSATADLIGPSTHVIPVYFRVEWVVWRKVDSGGGFLGAFDTEEQARNRVAEAVSEGDDIDDDLEVIDTPVHYCLMVKPDMTVDQMVISMPRSKAKVSRRWNAVIAINGGDRFSRVYRLSTFKDANKKGQTFYNYVVTPAGFAPKPLFEKAEALYNVFKSGAVRANYEDAIDMGTASEI
jgi:hypothetical protein